MITWITGNFPFDVTILSRPQLPWHRGRTSSWLTTTTMTSNFSLTQLERRKGRKKKKSKTSRADNWKERLIVFSELPYGSLFQAFTWTYSRENYFLLFRNSSFYLYTRFPGNLIALFVARWHLYFCCNSKICVNGFLACMMWFWQRWINWLSRE